MINFQNGILICKVRVLTIEFEDENLEDENSDIFNLPIQNQNEEQNEQDTDLWTNLGIDISIVKSAMEEIDTGFTIIYADKLEYTIDIPFVEFLPFWIKNRNNFIYLKNN